MANPSTERLTKSYLAQQTDRTIATLKKILARDPIETGRVVPTADDLAIHDGRRLEATVMFLDICKFSGRPGWTEQDQETLLRILCLFFTEMIRVIEDYGGIVEKNTGDGLMAYFVRRPEDTAAVQQRALAAALTMFAAAERLINPILQRSHVDKLHFRVCMDHGPITIAKVGAARGFNGIVAIGTTANIAAKMLAVAERDTILIGTKMLEGIPTAWSREFVQLKTMETGWMYTATNVPYAFWEYTGRWKEPLI